MKKFIALVLLISTDQLWAPEEFTVAKKKRISTAHLKEAIGQTTGNTIKNLVDCNVTIGQALQVFVGQMTEILEQHESSFFAKGSKEQLKKYLGALEHFEQLTRECALSMSRAFNDVQQVTKL